MVNLSNELVKLTMAVQEAELSINELSETYKAIENRYHPLIRFMLTIWGKIKW